jgi:hypothetical protein
VDAFTVHVVPDPVTELIVAPLIPVATSAKFAEVTPLTDSENFTIHATLAALEGSAPVRVIETTVGGSETTETGELDAAADDQDRNDVRTS